MKTQNRFVTHYELEVDGIRYLVCIRDYDEEHYTANWLSATGDERGELGYGLGKCSDIERDVERRIRTHHQERASACTR